MTLPYSDAIFVLRLPARVHRGVPRGPRPGLRLLRRRARGGSATTTPRSPSPGSPAAATARLTDEFLRLKSHHLFEDHFCLVRRPNEKGHVETLVGFARRNFLVPVPAVHGGLEPLNARLEARLPRRPGAAAAGQAGDQGRAARRGAGGAAAAAGRGVRGRPGRAAQRPTRCRWSASTPTTTRCRPRYAHHRVTVVGTVDTRPDRRRRPRGGRAPPVLGPRAGHLRPGPLPGPAGAQARGAGLRGAAGGLGAAGLLRRPAPPAGGRVRRAGDAAVHQGPAAAGAGEPAGADPGGRAGVGAGRGRRRRGAADPGAPRGSGRWACSASTAGRT